MVEVEGINTEVTKARQAAERSLLVAVDSLSKLEDTLQILDNQTKRFSDDIDKLRSATSRKIKELRVDLKFIRNDP